MVNETLQADGNKLMHPEQGSDCDEVSDPDEENGTNFLSIFCFSSKSNNLFLLRSTMSILITVFWMVSYE